MIRPTLLRALPVPATTSKLYATFLPIDPLPCPRPRVAVIRGHGVAYYPASYKKWVTKFVELFASSDIPFFEGPVHVDLLFLITKARTSKLQFPGGDVDNYAKSVLDGLTKIQVWKDDKQVVSLHVTKRFAGLGESAGIQLSIEASS